MNDIAFSEPVILRLPGIGERKIATSFEAIQCLENEWPDWARGRSWRSAHIACRDVLDGWRDARKARQRLVKAARRAGILAVQRHGMAEHRRPAGARPATASAPG